MAIDSLTKKPKEMIELLISKGADYNTKDDIYQNLKLLFIIKLI